MEEPIAPNGEDEIIRPIFSFLVQTIKNRFPRPLSNAVILDLGGGRGGWLDAFLPEQPKRLLVVDLDGNVLRQGGQERDPALPPWDAICGEAAALPLQSGSIDVLVSRNSFHLWPDQPRALGEAFRVLVPGGGLLIGRGFGPNLPETLYQEVKDRRRRFRQLAGNPGDATPSPTSDQTRQWLERSGFRAIEIIPDRKSYWAFALKPG